MVLSIQDPAVQSYFVYSAILALKLFAVALLTTLKRTAKKSYVNPEDAAIYNVKVTLRDEEVERVRRAHLNDLENIPVFWLLGALYLTTGPAAAWATLLFRVYTISRILHTIVYAVVPLPQPARFIAFIIPMMIQCYLAIQVVMSYASAL